MVLLKLVILNFEILSLEYGDKPKAVALDESNPEYVPDWTDKLAEPLTTVGTSLNGVEKPTKSQQRRLNAQKGLGAVTDDQVREQEAAARERKNAARRAKRAAMKKAAAKGGETTTTTTTQAGQTSLV